MASYDDTATVSGSVVSIENGADDVPTKSLIVTIPPTISGVSVLNEKQTGKTVFYPMDIEQGSISGSGFNSNSTTRVRTAERKAVTPLTQYKIKVNSEVQIYEVHEYTDLTGSSTHLTVNASEYTFTTKSTTNYLKILFRYSNNATITPSAITELQVTDGDFYWKTYTASLGRTIYGGTADIVNSTGKDTTLRYELDENDSWSAYSGASHSFWHNVATGEDRPIKQTEASESICNYATYSSASPSSAPDFSFLIQGGQRIVVTADSTIDTVDKFKTWLSSHNLVFVCPSSTPTDYTFDGQEVPTRLGYNAFWSDSGDTELTYYKSGYGFTSVTVNKTGKNLIDGTKFTRGLPSTTIGASIDTITTSNRYAYYGVRAGGGSLTVSSTSSDSDYFTLVLIWGYKNGVLTYYSNTQAGTSKTVDFSNCDYVRIGIGSTSGAITVPTDLTGYGTIQLELGSQATAYEPYEAVTKTAKLHKVIYGGKADVIRGTCEPKNLIKVPYYASSGSVSGGITYTYDNMGRVTCNGENTGTGNSVFYLEKGVYIQNYPSGTYYFSQEGFPYQSGTASTVQLTICSKLDGTVTQRIQLYSNTTGKSFTVSDNEYINDVFIRIASGKSADFTVNIQLEKGGTGTDFSPYFTPFSFPPISMETDEGENTLFANEGDSAITYRKAVD